MERRAQSRGWLATVLPRRARIMLSVGALLGVAGLVFQVAHSQLNLGGSGADSFTYNWLYDGLILGSAASCLARGVAVGEERAAWLLLAAGLAFDATGEIYYSLTFGDSGRRIDRFSASTWLDGGIVALTAAAAVASLAFEPIISAATHGSAAAIATNLAIRSATWSCWDSSPGSWRCRGGTPDAPGCCSASASP